MLHDIKMISYLSTCINLLTKNQNIISVIPIFCCKHDLRYILNRGCKLKY